MGKHRDWTEIRDDYQTSGLSYAALSKKYSVPIDSLKKAAIRQGWVKREKAIRKAFAQMAPDENGTIETAPSENGTKETAPRIRKEERFERTVEALLAKAEEAIEIAGPEEVDKIRKLASALRDLQGLLRLGKDELDMEEQKARIEKLRADAETGGPPEPVVVRFVNREWSDAGA